MTADAINLDDIFESWRNKKFVVVDRQLISPLISSRGHLVVLSDFVYWADRIDELASWCKTNGGDIQGSTVLFEQEHELTAFILKWS